MSLTAKLPSSQSALSMYRYMGLFLPKCRTFELVFTALKLSSLLRTHWMAALFHLPFPRKKTHQSKAHWPTSSPESFFLTFPKTGVTPAFLLYSDSSSNHLVQPKTESELTVMSGIFYSTSKCISSGPITTCPVCLSNL